MYTVVVAEAWEKCTFVPLNTTVTVHMICSDRSANSADLQWQIKLSESSANPHTISNNHNNLLLNAYGYQVLPSESNHSILLDIQINNTHDMNNKNVISCVNAGLKNIPTIQNTTLVMYGKSKTIIAIIIVS